ncbi:restriction endonuclease, SacI family [Limnothrix sp. FACHB-1083]|uniref:restriction endonuclease, SacI family n=1 Tax=unclassified Limnothrix TaxID=2632864 RepID=UPI0016814770|nr:MULTISPECIES: restriction endonuclease, SacI family [unclassified Limnothrix]MBD2162421.1 restriction endonuclease, SacI family [Limnothrix sp. FACHB-1083]MBD2193436.1 restriction endonuclease, SacI family [Limnothrix sp. FACHB-1088]
MTPDQILGQIYQSALIAGNRSLIQDSRLVEHINRVCQCTSNRSGVRFLMACLLGKLDRPEVDPRKPYTKIGGSDSFSGRRYDEDYLTPFINQHQLPVNSTTAFLTPTFRNHDQPLTTDRELVGRPVELYRSVLILLEDVAESRISAEDLLAEIVRVLLEIRDEQLHRINSLLSSLERSQGSLPLSTEAIIKLITQHLACKNSSRLPVLIVAAAYQAARYHLGEKILSLQAHNAADLQTGSLGDIEITLQDDSAVITAYEMKMRAVTKTDIDSAISKILKEGQTVQNYIFITTEPIDQQTMDYAATWYEKTDGVEVSILDCLSFLRHFLHLFHRIRQNYLNAYQDLVLNEPNSSVSQALKEAFLALRQAAESDD